jgi:predicted AlkP superfamily phosphohydrolase/phosphomutase
MSKQVSPAALLKDEPVKSYQSRAFNDVGGAIGTPADSARACMKVEKKRIECALHLLKSFPCERFILRLTLFDQLYHLFGLNYLQTENHVIYNELVEFCAYLDAAMSEIISASGGQVHILSGYSHQSCKRTLNLNSILEQEGLLQVTEELDDTQKQRISAATKILGFEPGQTILSSYEGQIDTKTTVAASSTYGTVFLNRSDVFENGSVTPASYEEKRTAVRQLLQKALASRFGDSLHIQEAPPESMRIAAPIPEFIINIDGVEFHNIRHANMRECDVPRTVHSSSGFLVVPKGRLGKDQAVKLTEITELFE